MAFKTHVGMADHIKRLRAINENVEKESIVTLLEAGELVRQEAMRSIRQGTIRGAGHVPSSPGQPPKGDTGRLETSIDVELRKTDKTVNVISNAPYSAALEFGTSTIEARPFLRPAMQKNRSRLVTAMAQVASGERAVRVFKNSNASVEGAADYIAGKK